LYGGNRAEIARGLILDMFKREDVRALVEQGRATALAEQAYVKGEK